METDISRKIIPIIKFTLPVIIILAVVINFSIWLYGQYHAYASFYDVRVVGTFVHAKTLTNGKLEKILVKDGQQVKAGQVLAEIRPNVTQKDIDNLTQAFQQAQEQYKNMTALNQQTSMRTITQPERTAPSAEARNNYDAALAHEKKMADLYSLGAVSKAEYMTAQADAATAKEALNNSGHTSYTPKVITTGTSSGITPQDIAVAKTKMNQAKAALEEAKNNNRLIPICADTDGIVYYTNLKNNMSISAGQNLFNIGTSNYMWLEAKAVKMQTDKIQEGAYVDCIINNEHINGTVAKILPPTTIEKKYIIKIFIPSDKMKNIKPNMIATVKIATKK
ncbi:HlyD family secretion protein [Pectinatus sottacetonis]|uniref:HlyD family secretion protein n=1 Tax=Pectinatus sottacetonis TaxID=1002795 RepID=UPI0018C4884D|nr:efflux RND transporter periplasmic adaptor subunit [Pectinatus sottacetonis]